jgi:hypothetical protein
MAQFQVLYICLWLSVCLSVFLDSRFTTVDPTGLPLYNFIHLKAADFYQFRFPSVDFHKAAFPVPEVWYPCRFYLRAYTYTVQTELLNKVFLQKVDYVLGFSCLNRLRYLNIWRTREEWLLISETYIKKYCIDDITVSTYHPLQSNSHQKLHTAPHTLPALVASPAVL